MPRAFWDWHFDGLGVSRQLDAEQPNFQMARDPDR
jgi:hypothetical protein